MLREAFNKTNADLKIGVGKIEAQLSFVSLDDSVAQATSEELKGRIFYAQQFRNLIAHKAGVADTRFVERCSALPYSPGDKVSISTAQLREWLAALVIYCLLIVNIDRARKGLEPWRWPLITPDPALESPYKVEWGYIHPDTGWWVPPVPIFTQVTL